MRVDRFGQLLKERAGRAPATWTRAHLRSERPQSQGLQNVTADLDFLTAIPPRSRGEAHPNRVPNAFLEQDRERGSGRNDALGSHPRFGQSKMQRVIASGG